MKYFGIPSDFKKETIDKYDELNKRYSDCKVIETYGQITVSNNMESGRSVDLLPRIDKSTLKEYVEYSNKKGMDFNYTLNAPYMRNKEFTKEGISEIKRLLEELHESGVYWLTIAMPSLMELVLSFKHKFKIKASTICQITNTNKALWYKELGAERIVLDESVNRSFDVMKNIRDSFGDKVEIIINSICHKDCINRMFHYNQISGDSVGVASESSTNYYPHRCVMKRYDDLSNFIRLSWVRPEDLKYYTEIGINYFKLQGRHLVMKGDPARAVECYMKESYDGNLLELLDMFSPTNSFNIDIDNKKLNGFIQPYFDNPHFCRSDCTSCKYCEAIARKCIDYESAEEVAELATMFYGQYDQYKKLLKEEE